MTRLRSTRAPRRCERKERMDGTPQAILPHYYYGHLSRTFAHARLLARTSVAQVLEYLSAPDIALTNAKDKELMLPVVKATNARVRTIFEEAARHEEMREKRAQAEKLKAEAAKLKAEAAKLDAEADKLDA